MLAGLLRESPSRLTSDFHDPHPIQPMADELVTLPEPTLAEVISPEVLVITAHPQMEHSRINRRLMLRAREVAKSTPNAPLIWMSM